MQTTCLALLLGTALVAAPASANIIDNGDFSQCDLSGWSTDSDGMPGNPADFTVAPSSTGCAATITIDNSMAMFNTLFQPLDLSAAGTAPLQFSYDFSVDSALTDQPLFSADYFSIGFTQGDGLFFGADGQPGTLFGQPDINGFARYQGSMMLDPMFAAQPGWFLEVQLVSNFDGAPASLTIDEFSITALANVPAPASAPLVLAGMGLLISRRRTIKEARV